MKVLYVYANPKPRSFNSALLEAGLRALEAAAHEVELSDLYAMGFDPVLSAAEITGQMRPDAQSEIEKLRRADRLILQFPDWWYGPPAILKGWIDRVMAYGFAYDDTHEFETGFLQGKKGLVVMTVGYKADYYAAAPQRDLAHLLGPLHYGTFAFVGMQALPPFIAYGPRYMSEEERKACLEAYARHLLEGL
ncbi:MAG: flavodoxin family protein [Meiothermus sp.]